MIRNRAAAIIVKDGKILLMHRRNNGHEYFSFPGGGVEEGETNEEACAREILEETSIKVTLGRLLYTIGWDDGSASVYYLCDYVSGEARLDPNAPEVGEMRDGTQYYNPEWIEVSALSDTLLYPLELRDLLIGDLKNGFSKKQKDLFIKVAERRGKI